MIHNHTYWEQISSGVKDFLCSAVGDVTMNCPSGHANCQLNVGLCTIENLETKDDALSNTGASANTEHHSHTYNVLVVDSYYTGMIVARSGGNNTCDSGGKTIFFIRGWTLDYSTAMHVESDVSSDAIWGPDFQYHYHTYKWQQDWGGEILTPKPCSLGHANCSFTASTHYYMLDPVAFFDEDSNNFSSQIITLPATNVKSNRATLNGIAEDEAYTLVGFEYGEVSGALDRTTIPDAYNSPFHKDITGLTSGTVCYFRAVGVIFGNTVYGNEETFTTTNPSVVTDDIEYMDTTMVLSSMLAYPEGESMHCGIQWWSDPAYKSINWYNPPGGTTHVTTNMECKVNIGGLSLATTYYWQAYAIDSVGNVYLGVVKNFTMPDKPPVIPPIFGLGNNYLTAKQASEDIMKVSDGRAYMDTEGSLVYERAR